MSPASPILVHSWSWVSTSWYWSRHHPTVPRWPPTGFRRWPTDGWVGSPVDMTEAEPILRRELTDIPDDVSAVPPPPIPELPAPYGLRLADPDADAEMIAEWMNLPHLAESWEYAWPTERWHRYLRAQLDSTFSRPFVASHEGADRG